MSQSITQKARFITLILAGKKVEQAQQNVEAHVDIVKKDKRKRRKEMKWRKSTTDKWQVNSSGSKNTVGKLTAGVWPNKSE